MALAQILEFARQVHLRIVVLADLPFSVLVLLAAERDCAAQASVYLLPNDTEARLKEDSTNNAGISSYAYPSFFIYLRMIAKNKILVIDDEPDIVKMLKTRLETGGYQVIAARDGIEGFKKAREQRPDLILLDIIMPEVDGLTVLRRLRSDEATCGIPVIMLTAKGMTDSIFEAQIYGATDYIIKPFRLSELLKFIKRYLVLFEKRQK